MKKTIDFIMNIEKYVSVLIILAMLAGMTYQTMARYIFHNGTNWMEEMCGYGLLCLVFISSSYACQHNAHLRVDSVKLLYPKKLAPYIEIAGNVVWLVFCVFLTYLGVEYVATAFQSGQRPLSINIPLGAIYIALPFGYGCMAIRLLIGIVHDIKKILKKSTNCEGGVK